MIIASPSPSDFPDRIRRTHDTGLIHRDVKPANIILSERGGMPDVAKIVDFGLVKSFDTAGPRLDLEVTSANLIVGTPLYMSPEAIRGDAALDGRSDLYSLGAVGYFLLTGTPVFAARSHVEVCSYHLHTPPEPLSSRSGRDIPDALERIILRCLAKRPEDRYENARALQSALDACALASSWDSDGAIQWWRTFKSGRLETSPAPPLPALEPMTITIDIGKRVSV